MILNKSIRFFIVIIFSLPCCLESEENNQKIYNLNAYNPFFENGFSVGCEYFGEVWTLENRNNLHIYNTNQLNGLFNFDLDEMFGFESTKIGITTISNFGKDPNEDFNSQQGITNIGALTATKFLQFYLEKGFWENRVNLTFGLLDINSEFDVKYSAKDFINPSHGIGIDWSQSGWNGPSIFPNTSLGARLKFLHKGNIIVQFAVMDGVPGDTSDQTSTHIILNENDGLLLCGNIYHITGEQIHTLPEHKPDAAFEHIGIGFWYYTETYNHVFSALTNWGMYFVFEQDAFIESGTTQGLSFFGRFGVADDEINSVDYFIGLGFVYKGLFGGRDDDLIGFSIANAHNSYLHRSINALGTNELNTEFFYSFVVSDFLTLQLDFQTFKLADKELNSQHTPVGGLRVKLAI